MVDGHTDIRTDIYLYRVDLLLKSDNLHDPPCIAGLCHIVFGSGSGSDNSSITKGSDALFACGNGCVICFCHCDAIGSEFLTGGEFLFCQDGIGSGGDMSSFSQGGRGSTLESNLEFWPFIKTPK